MSKTFRNGNFIKFCKDFELVSDKCKHGYLNRTQIQEVFKNNSTAKEMDFEQFLNSLKDIAVTVYHSEAYGELIDQRSEDEKVEFLFTRLKCDQPEFYQQKLKPFG